MNCGESRVQRPDSADSRKDIVTRIKNARERARRIATATAKGTAASVAAAKAEDAAASVVVRSLLDQRPLQPSFLDMSGCDWLHAATYEKFLGDIRVLVSLTEEARIRWVRRLWRDFCRSIAISTDGVDAACSLLTASAAVPL
jgi:hypothetical protein